MSAEPILHAAVIWAVCMAVGLGACGLLFPRRWQRDRIALAPLVGAGVLALLASVASYAGASMQSAMPFILGASFVLSAAGLAVSTRGCRTRRDWRAASTLHLLGAVAACGVLAAPVIYRAWDPYSDAFTYISIADYLQAHSYFEPAVPGSSHPVLSQMAMYQRFGFRMGSNFLLAFFTALRHADYSFDLYMPTLALSLWVAVPSFMIFCRRACLLPTRVALLATALYALHAAVPLANALRGFMPQAWGQAFAIAALAFYMRIPSVDRVRAVLTVGVFLGLVVLCYPEVFPFVAAAGVGAHLTRIAARVPVSRAVASGLMPILAAMAVVPIAAFQFLGVMAVQVNAVVGWDPQLTSRGYLSMLAGQRATGVAFFEPSRAIAGALHALALASCGTAVYGFLTASPPARRIIATFAAPFVLALAWFALFSGNPRDPRMSGDPWRVYKLVTYGFFLFVPCVAIGLAALWRRGGARKLFAATQIAAAIIFFALGVRATALSSVRMMRAFTTDVRDPIGEYKQLTQLPGLAPEAPVNLFIPTEPKHRQLVAYFIRRPVIADWSDDGYIAPYLEPRYRAQRLDPAHPTLEYTTRAEPGAPGRLLLRRNLRDVGVSGTFAKGWYGREEDSGRWWHWLERSGTIEFSVPYSGVLTVAADVAIVTAPQRTVTIGVDGHDALDRQYILNERWFTPFTSEPISVTAGRHVLTIRADGEARRITAEDPRIVRMGIRDLTLRFVPDEK
jgi:hypothetical protein